MRLVAINGIDGEQLWSRKVPDGSTIAQAMRAAGYDCRRRTIALVKRGKELVAIPRSKWAETIPRGNIVISPLPAGGDGLKSVLRLVAMLALIVAAPMLAPGLAAALGGAISLATAQSLILFGGSIFLAFAFAPKAKAASTADRESVHSLSTSNSIAQPWKPHLYQVGRVRAARPFLTPPYSETFGNKIFEYRLLEVGYGEFDLERIDADDTPIWNPVDGFLGNFVGSQIQVAGPGEDITLFPVQTQTSEEVQSLDIPTTTAAGPFVANSADTLATSLLFDYMLPEGLALINNKGAATNHSITIEFTYQEVDNAGTPIDTPVTTSVTHTLNTQTPQRFTKEITLPSAMRVRASMRRTVAENEDLKYLDKLAWTALRARIEGPTSFPNITTIAIKMEATDRLNGSIGQLSVLCTRKTRTWSTGGGWTAPTANRSIAWAVADILSDATTMCGLSDSLIPLAKLESLHSGWEANGEKCDLIVNDTIMADELLSKVLATGRSVFIYANGTVDIVRDDPVTAKRYLFNDRNIIEGTLEKETIFHSTDEFDSVLVNYRDETSWKQRQVYYPDGTPPTNPMVIDDPSITNRDHAYRYAQHVYRQNRHRRQTIKFQTDMEGLFLKKLDMIRVSSELFEAELVGAYSLDSRSGTELNLREQILDADLPNTDGGGRFGYIRIKDKRRKDWGPVKAYKTGPRQLTLDAGSLAAVEVAQGSLTALLPASNRAKCDVLLYKTNPIIVDCRINKITHMKDYVVEIHAFVDSSSVYAQSGTADPDPDIVLPSDPIYTLLPAPRDLRLNRVALNGVISAGANWEPVAGASLYEASVSYDAGLSWTPIYSGSDSAFAFTSIPTEAVLRVRASQPRVGLWAQASSPYVSPVIVATDTEDGIVTGSSLSEALQLAHSQIADELLQRDLILEEIAAVLGRVNLGVTALEDRFVLKLRSATGAATAQFTQVTAALTTATTALATSITELSVTVGGKADVTVVDALTARVDTAEDTISIYGGRITTLEVDYTDIASDVATNASAITTINTTISDIEGELTTQASQLTSLTASYNDVSASAQFFAQAIAAESGYSSMIELRTVAMGVNPSALRLTATSGGESGVDILAEHFRVFNPLGDIVMDFDTLDAVLTIYGGTLIAGKILDPITGTRWEQNISEAYLKIRDTSEQLRVQMGDLSA